MAPIIFLTTQSPPDSNHGLFDVLIASIAPAASLLIFLFGTLWTARVNRKQRMVDLQDERARRDTELLRDQKLREAERDRDRASYHLNMKRDVFLEASPAIAQAYQSLALFFDEKNSADHIASQFNPVRTAMSKVMTVASDQTLGAAQSLMLELSRWHIRMLKERLVSAKKDPKQKLLGQIALWRGAISAIPAKMADYIQASRNEIFLDFDRATFLAGMDNTNTELQKLLDEMLEMGQQK